MVLLGAGETGEEEGRIWIGLDDNIVMYVYVRKVERGRIGEGCGDEWGRVSGCQKGKEGWDKEKWAYYSQRRK